MCGFVATYGNQFDDASVPEGLLQATRIIEHRGPDDEAFYVSSRFSAGFRRLKIIDLSDHARQPMSDESGRYWIVFNGEVYNYRELRPALEGLGCRFRTSSDTEVLLQAYVRWGESCLHRLNGMFAFLIWDQQDRTLFGARDRFGEKPLYYTQDDGRWMFASEIKSLIALLGRVPDPHPAVLKHYVQDRWTDSSSQTFFEGISSLPAAHCLSVRNNQLKITRYWDLEPDKVLVDKNPVPRFQELLFDSIRLRTNADVTVGTCLSGGLDSGTIVCAIPQVLDAATKTYSGKTFTAAYPEYDERLPIEDIIRTSGATGFTDTPIPGSLSDLQELLWYHDEPFHSFMALASHRIMRRARQEGVTVLLNGQGADETLAGYAKYFPCYLQELLGHWQFGAAWHSARQSQELTGQSGWRSMVRATRSGCRGLLGRFLRRRGLLAPPRQEVSSTATFLQPGFLARCTETPLQNSLCDSTAETLNGLGPLKARLYDSIFRHNLPLYLRVEDRNSMANSIESRLPFLDHRLVEYAFATPTAWLMRDGQNKHLLRQAAANILPPSVLNRRQKFGFPVPEVGWLYNSFRTEVMELLESREFKQRGIFDAGRLSQMYQQECDVWTRNPKSLWARRSLWFRIISAEYWYRGLSRYRELPACSASTAPPIIVNRAANQLAGTR